MLEAAKEAQRTSAEKAGSKGRRTQAGTRYQSLPKKSMPDQDG